MSCRIIFFGTRCSFADTVLESLIGAGHDIAARIVPGSPDAPTPFQEINGSTQRIKQILPLMDNSTSAARTREKPPHPVVMVHQHSSQNTADYLRQIHADLAIVCCYPRRIPMRLIETARLGGLNIHPSLLPAYRGPEPLFWLYRDGVMTSGVTIHKVDSTLDTGPVVAQRQIELDIGTPGDHLWMQCAHIASEMSREILVNLPSSLDESVSQSSSSASYFTWPGHEDLLIDPAEWDAWRIFHFCRGVIPLGYSPNILVNEVFRRINAAKGFATDDSSAAELDCAEGTTVSCRSGSVCLSLS